VLGYLLIPESRDSSAPKLDPLGSALSIAGLGELLWAIIEGPGKGWGSAEVLGGFAVAAVVLTAFFMWEARCSSPMLDVHFFKNRRFSAASGAITVTFLTLFGTIFLLTQYFQSVLGYSTIKAGAVLVPQSVLMMIFAPLSPRWVHRFGNKLVVVAGMLVAVATLLLMTTFDADSSTLHVVVVTALLGLGVSHIMPPATESIMGSLPREKAGVGSAMNDTTRQVGGAVGVALLGSILSSQFGSHVSDALAGVAPAGVIDGARDSVGAALGLARDNPDAQPFAGQITEAAHQGFVNGFHTALLVAAGILVLAAAGVLSGSALGGNRQRRRRYASRRCADGHRPVDVVPADMATDLALELESEYEHVHRGTEAHCAAGRPRSEDREREIMAAALEALVAEGYDGMSVEGVAARAGAGKATVYRRWRNKAELVADAIREHACRDIELPDTGDARADLRAFLRDLQGSFEDFEGKLIAVFTAERMRHPDLAAAFDARFVSQRRAYLETIVRRAIERGELPADTDVELLAEVGPAILLHQFVKGGGKLPDDVADRRPGSSSADRTPRSQYHQNAQGVDDWGRQGDRGLRLRARRARAERLA
jgi:AcrR family transcriptional regulator